VDEMLRSCSFCDLGTAAWRPTFDKVEEPVVFRNLAVACIVPSALR